MTIVLTISFFLVAVLYAMVGFGGGSSYIALLAVVGTPYQSIPIVALICNLIVVSGGSCHFTRSGHFKWPLFWPFMLGSVPLAFVGGRIPLSKTVYLVLLGICLILAGLRLLVRVGEVAQKSTPRWPLLVLIGAALGLLSGMVGIGGGIFLSPIILNLGWGRPKQAAATASLFIFLNSLSGLAGQIVKHAGLPDLRTFWPLFLAVLIGGQLGSIMGTTRLPQVWVKGLTGILVLLIGIQVLLRANG